MDLPSGSRRIDKDADVWTERHQILDRAIDMKRKAKGKEASETLGQGLHPDANAALKTTSREARGKGAPALAKNRISSLLLPRSLKAAAPRLLVQPGVGVRKIFWSPGAKVESPEAKELIETVHKAEDADVVVCSNVAAVGRDHIAIAQLCGKCLADGLRTSSTQIQYLPFPQRKQQQYIFLSSTFKSRHPVVAGIIRDASRPKNATSKWHVLADKESLQAYAVAKGQRSVAHLVSSEEVKGVAGKYVVVWSEWAAKIARAVNPRVTSA